MRIKLVWHCHIWDLFTDNCALRVNQAAQNR